MSCEIDDSGGYMDGLDMLIRLFAGVLLSGLSSIRGHIPQCDRFEPFRGHAGTGAGGAFGHLTGLVTFAGFAAALVGAVVLAVRSLG